MRSRLQIHEMQPVSSANFATCQLCHAHMRKDTRLSWKAGRGLGTRLANGTFEHLLVYEPHFHGNTTKYGSDCLATLFANSCLLIEVYIYLASVAAKRSPLR